METLSKDELTNKLNTLPSAVRKKLSIGGRHRQPRETCAHPFTECILLDTQKSGGYVKRSAFTECFLVTWFRMVTLSSVDRIHSAKILLVSKNIDFASHERVIL